MYRTVCGRHSLSDIRGVIECKHVGYRFGCMVCRTYAAWNFTHDPIPHCTDITASIIIIWAGADERVILIIIFARREPTRNWLSTYIRDVN